jgi:dihydroorotate dehydrogenase (fumarate)
MDLTTTYMGMQLKNPLVAAASPLSEHIDNIRLLEEKGASAVVMYSLFEEQITRDSDTLDHFLSFGAESHGEALSYFPEMETYRVGPQEYLEGIAQAKRAVDIPVMGSLNGVSSGGWIEYARLIEEAGADGLELNIYFIPTSIQMTGPEVEQMYVDIVRDVKKSVKIPVAVKLSPFFSATGNMAKRLVDTGANALVMFNRFYQPDFDLEELEVVPHLVLSNSFEMRLPLRWIAVLYGRLKVDFAISRGVHTYDDVLKGMMAGANVAQLASELLRNGIGRVGEILGEMQEWMETHEYESIKQMRGSMSMKNVKEPAAFERANYMKVLHSWKPDPTGRLHF